MGLTDARIAEIEHWLAMCGQDKSPDTKWARVVHELLAAVKAAQGQEPTPTPLRDCRMNTIEAARILGVAPRTVCKWVDNDRLKATREEGSGNRLIRPCDLQAFMQEWAMTPAVEDWRGSNAEQSTNT